MNRLAAPLLILLFLAETGAAHTVQDSYREAYDTGHSTGFQLGRQDLEQGLAYDFANKAAYQNAREGFDPSRHELDVYAVAYRRGFEDGYETGYGLASEEPVRSSRPDRSAGPSSDTHYSSVATLPRETQISIRLLETLSTQRNEKGDDFRAEVTQDLLLDGQVVIRAGARVYGMVTHVKRAGRIRGRAEMNLRFDELELQRGERIRIEATVASIEQRAEESVKSGEGTIEGPGTKSEDAKQVAKGSGIGALLGVLTGGGRGAAIGGAIGAGAGLAGVLASRGEDIVLPSETEMVIKLDQEAEVPVGILRPAP